MYEMRYLVCISVIVRCVLCKSLRTDIEKIGVARWPSEVLDTAGSKMLREQKEGGSTEDI